MWDHKTWLSGISEVFSGVSIMACHDARFISADINTSTRDTSLGEGGGRHSHLGGGGGGGGWRHFTLGGALHKTISWRVVNFGIRHTITILTAHGVPGVLAAALRLPMVLKLPVYTSTEITVSLGSVVNTRLSQFWHSTHHYPYWQHMVFRVS